MRVISSVVERYFSIVEARGSTPLSSIFFYFSSLPFYPTIIAFLQSAEVAYSFDITPANFRQNFSNEITFYKKGNRFEIFFKFGFVIFKYDK